MVFRIKRASFICLISFSLLGYGDESFGSKDPTFSSDSRRVRRRLNDGAPSRPSEDLPQRRDHAGEPAADPSATAPVVPATLDFVHRTGSQGIVLGGTSRTPVDLHEVVVGMPPSVPHESPSDLPRVAQATPCRWPTPSKRDTAISIAWSWRKYSGSTVRATCLSS